MPHPSVDAAWSYPHPSPLARRIRGHVAFWRGVRIEGGRERPGPLARLLGRPRDREPRACAMPLASSPAATTTADAHDLASIADLARSRLSAA
jgi:hypothetical protein